MYQLQNIAHTHNGDTSHLDSGGFDSDSESGDDPVYFHQLDLLPPSFLHRTESKRSSVFGNDNTHRSTSESKESDQSFLIPEIPRRCNMYWSLGTQLASGTGAVVFNADCVEYVHLHGCRKVARISQLRTEKDTQNFTRDVQARYLLSRHCPDVPITGLVDAFICSKNTKTFGVSISERFDSTLIKHLLSRNSSIERLNFVEELPERLGSIVRSMHSCKIVHRDLHHGNVLLRYSSTGDVLIALTDFESALGDYFKTSVRVFSAYLHSDHSAILVIVAQLGTICQYLDREIQTLDPSLLEDLGINLSDLDPLRKQGQRDFDSLLISVAKATTFVDQGNSRKCPKWIPSGG